MKLFSACRLAIVFALAFSLSGLCGVAGEAKYPSKPIQVITGYGSGGDADINGRIFSKYMEKYLGKSLVFSNITGAGGSVGAAQVKNSAPDGYTVLFSHWGSLMNTLMGIGGFKLLDDFEIVGIAMVDGTTLFCASSTGKYKTMKELMDDAKANPEMVKFSIEVGSVVHLTASVLQDANKVKFHVVDTGNQGNRVASLLSNQIDVAVFQYGAAAEYLKSGDFIALGALSDKRNPNYPDIPTLKEQGVLGLEPFEEKFFFYAFPKGTPQDIVAAFADAMKKVVEDPGAKKDFGALFVDLKFMDHDAAVKHIQGVSNSFTPYLDTLKK